jgi:hypothetical protein
MGGGNGAVIAKQKPGHCWPGVADTSEGFLMESPSTWGST